ncbi:CBS domain-containing protein [Mesohalobacter halotolerans]|uniref:CBS domain-containing protein n=1 Tax=Mesohalobacter halotolerans TaxID=1883405 RepID=A0A4U5TNC5_9FLAO|nr:CBS domain-containing protein [Mesohalobacter halotolerans]MBS3737629.1 hypothetical protein [Psychroflexus sp.]TKS55459.1 CBS domain-containing protein [Mesohalobacter halotolerans]
MKFENHIHNTPALKVDQSILEAKNLFDKSKLNSLVVLKGSQFKGLVFEEDLCQYDNTQTIEEQRELLKDIYLYEDFSIFDWFKIISQNQIHDIPIISKANKYLGNLNFNDIINKFANTGLNVEMSSILILSKPSTDFRYSEIFQIIEANEAKVYGSYINYTDKDRTEVVVNLHHQGLNELLQSFRRYDYNVISFHQEDQHRETLKNNSEYLSKYLTV